MASRPKGVFPLYGLKTYGDRQLMSWLGGLVQNKNKPIPCDISKYPSRTYKKVLCSRQHCTESCYRAHTDQYKFWALFFCERNVNRAELFLNLATMPDRIRFGTYLHVLAPEKALMKMSGEGGCGVDSKGDGKAQSEADLALVQEILQLCNFFAFDDPDSVFHIYKAIERDYPVNKDFVGIILLLYKMHGADEEGVYSVAHELIGAHDLLTAFGAPRADEADKSVGDEEVQTNGDEEVQTSGDNTGDRASDQENEPISPDENQFVRDDPLDNDAIADIWRIVLKEKTDIFVQMTDLAVSLNCTYPQIMDRAAAISLYRYALQITTVLAAKGNNHYYRSLCRNESPERREKRQATQETYFDFLIIQNELIKGQENIKSQLTEQIEALEKENRRLMDENKGLQGSIHSIRSHLQTAESKDG